MSAPPIPCNIPDCGSNAVTRGMCSAHYQRWLTHGDPLAGRTKVGEPMRFFKRAMEASTDDCIFWPYGRYLNGYGKIRHHGRSKVASNLMCLEVHGRPEHTSLLATHSCGKGHLGCINPRHLRWATQTENMADRIKHGTSNRGERQGHSKLTSDDVKAIIDLLASGMTCKQIADTFGVERRTIGHIKSGTTWGWLTGGQQ